MSNLIIFGAGKIGIQVYNEIAINLWGGKIYDKILFYDSDSGKQGTYINGIYVLTNKDFLDLIHSENCEVILAGSYWRDQLDFLRKLEIENIVVNVFDEFSFSYRCVYGQEAEDVYLMDKFSGKYGENYTGFYVDIGAHHPYRFSNTYWAYMKGWKGINIEPNSNVLEMFDKTRCRDININCGIGNKEGIMKYYKFEDPALNTFESQEFDGLRIPLEVVNVPVRTLKSIFDEYKINKVDFMNIDVEGYELQVLESNNWDLINPAYILVEQKNMTVSELIKSSIYLNLKELGYDCEYKSLRTAIYYRV